MTTPATTTTTTTAPTTTAAPAVTTTAPAAAPASTSWLKTHEKLLIVTIISVLSFFAVRQGISVYDAHLLRQDVATASVPAQKLSQQQSTNDQLASQNAALMEQIKTLATAIQTTKTQIVQVPTQIAQVPDNQLQTDIETKLGGSLLSTPILRTVDTEVTEYPIMQKELNEINADVTAYQKSNTNLQTQIAGLNAELTDEQQVCQAQIGLAVQQQKTKDNKHKGFWEKFAFVAGAILGGFVGRAI